MLIHPSLACANITLHRLKALLYVRGMHRMMLRMMLKEKFRKLKYY